MTYGLFIATARSGEKQNGCIVNTVIQVSADPMIIAVSINRANYTNELVGQSKKFAVSILDQTATLPFIGQFGFKSGRAEDKFKGVKVQAGKTGSPIVLDYTLGYIEAEVISQIDVGTHTVFFGRVVEADVLSSAEPLAYAYYHNVIKGKTPVNAATYIRETVTGADKYVCKVCGYVYDPAIGDPDAGVKPGTKFEDIPNTWVCPVCGADKSQFEKVGA